MPKSAPPTSPLPTSSPSPASHTSHSFFRLLCRSVLLCGLMAAIKSVYWSWVFIAWMLSNLKSNSSFFSSNNPPESRCISLLQRLKKTPTHIAVVLDELEVRSSDIEKAAGTDDGQIDLETIANVHDIISWCAAAQCSVLTLHDPQGVLFRCSDVIMDSFVTCSTTRTKTIDPDRPQSKIISDTLPSTKLRNRTDPYKRNNDNAVSNIDSNNHNHTQSVAKPQSTSTSSKSIIISVSRLDKTTYPRSTSSPAPAAQYLLLTDTVTMRVNFTGSAHGLDYMAEKLNQQISNTSAAAAAETSALLPTLDDVTVEWVNQVLLVDDGLSEPDLLYVCNALGAPLTLKSFPPWYIRLTEIFHANTCWNSSPRRLLFTDFWRGLMRFVKVQHRFGK